MKRGGFTDKNSFAELLYADKARYYRIAWSYVKNEQDALDIVSEAAYRGLLGLHTLKSRESFRPWMTRIVVNCALDLLRRGRRTEYIEDLPPQSEPVSDAEPGCEDSLDLCAALDCLSGIEKSCVIVRFFEGYRFKELAEMLGEPESTVKTRVHRALKKMRAYLGEEHCYKYRQNEI